MIFTFSAGGNALANYLNAAQAQSGLTSDEILPPYTTNIPGGGGHLFKPDCGGSG